MMQTVQHLRFYCPMPEWVSQVGDVLACQCTSEGMRAFAAHPGLNTNKPHKKALDSSKHSRATLDWAPHSSPGCSVAEPG